MIILPMMIIATVIMIIQVMIIHMINQVMTMDMMIMATAIMIIQAMIIIVHQSMIIQTTIMDTVLVNCPQ